MSRILRAAMTQTKNAYEGMPERVEDLFHLAGKLEEVRAANIAHHESLVEAAASMGVQALCMGELCMGPYFALSESPLWFDLAEDAKDGPSVTAMRASARRYGMLLVVPVYEYDPATQKRFNTAVVIDGNGVILGRYRKTHIPHGANERAAFLEDFYYCRSDAPPFFPVFQTSIGRIGISICYDRHFPGVVRSLALGGAELVFCPAVTFGAKSRRMWDLEFEVDAARYGVFIGGSNRKGSEPPWNVEFFGESRFVGPEGRIMPAVHESTGVRPDPRLVVADLDLDSLASPDSAGWNLRANERPDAYL